MGWIVMTVLCVVLGLASIFPVLMTPMLFDAPGSTSNRFTIAIAVAMVALPVTCLLGAVLPWVFRPHAFAKALFLLPLLDLVVIAALFGCLQYFCGGLLGGPVRPD
jgi:ABC-type sulfate transport system permease subunit